MTRNCKRGCSPINEGGDGQIKPSQEHESQLSSRIVARIHDHMCRCYQEACRHRKPMNKTIGVCVCVCVGVCVCVSRGGGGGGGPPCQWPSSYWVCRGTSQSALCIPMCHPPAQDRHVVSLPIAFTSRHACRHIRILSEDFLAPATTKTAIATRQAQHHSLQQLTGAHRYTWQQILQDLGNHQTSELGFGPSHLLEHILAPKSPAIDCHLFQIPWLLHWQAPGPPKLVFPKIYSTQPCGVLISALEASGCVRYCGLET